MNPSISPFIPEILVDTNQQEKTSHGSYDFPLALYFTEMSKKNLGYINWHWHEEFQFCLVMKGTLLFSINTDEYLT